MKSLALVVAAFVLVAAPGSVLAQDDFGDSGEEDFDPVSVDDGSSTVELEAEGEGTAEVERDGAGLGVGVHAMLTGPAGAAVIYDPGKFHIEGLLGFVSNGVTSIGVGGRFWYHLHTSTAADFSLGGGLAIVTVDNDPADDTTDVNFEVGGQLRAFVVPNVAISATVGLAVVTGDSDFVGLDGQLIGSLGLSYFF